jgi:hypothetical protein
MYLFTRQGQLALGQQLAAMEWAVGITEKVNQITSINVGLWSPMLSPGLGTLSWGAAVESLGDLEDADAKLMADPMYLDALEKGSAFFAGTIDDQVAQYVLNPDPDPATSHVAVVQTTIANGALAHGIEVGIAIAQKATEICGLPTAFLMASTGSYGGCAWITSATSVRALEAGEQAVNTNADFVALIDKEAAACFLPGVATQSIWRRVV